MAAAPQLDGGVPARGIGVNAPGRGCPSLLAPMPSGDGLLVRVKPRAATLTASQAEDVAAGTGRYGNGILELTNRGHLQLRGFAHDGIKGFADRMARAGLAAAHPRAEAVRNVLVDPLGPDDPAARFDSHRLAHRLSALLEGDPALQGLPDKFGLLVDSGRALSLAGCTADIMLRSADANLAITLDGGDSRLCLPEDEAVDALRRLLAVFLAWTRQDGRTAGTPRMRAMVAALGVGDVYQAAGLHGAKRMRRETAASRPAAGFTPLAGRGFFLLGAPFGALDAAALAALAGMARRFADGTIRVTPWKAVALSGVARSNARALAEAAEEAGLVTRPDDARQRIVTCAGRPRCASAHADTRADSARLAAMDRAAEGLLHVSGCAKGCAHPGVAPATLVATADGYDLVRGGRAADAPERRGLTLAQAAGAAACGPGR